MVWPGVRAQAIAARAHELRVLHAPGGAPPGSRAAGAGHGRIFADAYSVAPCGIFVHPDSDIRTPEDLAGVPISVGYQSGSHYATIEALDMFLEPGQIELSFADGLLFSRMESLIDREVPAVTVFSGPMYFLEQLGFRKIVDTSFMMAAMIDEKAGLDDV